MTVKAAVKWDPETVKNILWFRANLDRIPQAPFTLQPGCTVMDREKFLANIESDIKAGPRGPRANTGAIQTDLATLRGMVKS